MFTAAPEVEKPPCGAEQGARSADNVDTDVQKSRTNGHVAMCIDTDPRPNGYAKVQPNSPCVHTRQGLASNKSPEKIECGLASDGTQTGNAIRKSSTVTVSKFKEKRPEPLKLNPTLNQDIPLDLSVKSAGNVPSGTLSNIFNLSSTSQMTTLETPRIQWQDNETLLATGKARLFSSSTNTSQKAQMSSLVGDSPPITPNTPLMDTMFPHSGPNLRSSSNLMPHSASLVLESPSNYGSQRAQILERWTKINKLKADLMSGPRRSCSSDNLSFHTTNEKQMTKIDRLRLAPEDKLKGLANGSAQMNKKSSISPLAIKSLSNTQNNSSSQNKFSYNNSQATSTAYDSQRSPLTTNSSTKPLTPTSLASATTNLLNIHLNSPTGTSQSPVTSAFELANSNPNQRSPYKSPSISAFDQEISPLDPLISATFCQQQYNSRTSSVNFPSPTSSTDPNINFQRNMIAFQHQNLPSISSSATLNTPTLISPSQAGQLCFLQSPTLSPMSSVFDLPSPFLMFPPTSQSQHCSSSKQLSPKFMATANDKSQTNEQIHRNEMQVHSASQVNDTSKNCDSLIAERSESGYAKLINVSSANDLSRLITSAAEKFAPSTQMSTERPKSTNHTEGINNLEMEMDCEISNAEIHANMEQASSSKSRPATTIPQICISNHHLEAFESSVSKSNVKIHRNERLESSSAPPDVYQRRARSKIKTIAADSCIDITYKNRASKSELDRAFSSSTSNIIFGGLQNGPLQSGSYGLSEKRLGQTNFEIRERLPTSGHSIHTQSCSSSQPGARSNSAEPAFYKSLLSDRPESHSSSVTNSNDIIPDCCQLAIQSNIGTSLSSSAGQLHHCSASQVAKPKDPNSLNQTTADGLNHSTLNANQQRQQHNPHTYYQNQTNQQHSSSIGELSRIAYDSMQRMTENMVATSQSVFNSRQSAGQFYKASKEAEQDFVCRNRNGISSSLNRVDYLLNECHQTQADSRRSAPDGTMYVDQGLIMRQASNQTSVINLLCNNETCQRQSAFVNNLQRSSTTSMATPLTMAQYNQNPVLISGEISTIPPRGMYQADLEARSESSSSNSLDFFSQFLDGNSRPSSEASSSMTSKKYHCDQCSKSFTRSDMLTRHKRLHSGDRPFQCGECKQEFSRSDHLSTHMRTHTGEKPYKCKLCSYSACRKDMITRHLKVHNRGPHSNDFI